MHNVQMRLYNAMWQSSKNSATERQDVQPKYLNSVLTRLSNKTINSTKMFYSRNLFWICYLKRWKLLYKVFFNRLFSLQKTINIDTRQFLGRFKKELNSHGPINKL